VMNISLMSGHCFFACFASSILSRSGITMSVKSTSTCCRAMMPSASSALLVAITRWPLPSMMAETAWRARSSSSTCSRRPRGEEVGRADRAGSVQERPAALQHFAALLDKTLSQLHAGSRARMQLLRVRHQQPVPGFLGHALTTCDMNARRAPLSPLRRQAAASILSSAPKPSHHKLAGGDLGAVRLAAFVSLQRSSLAGHPKAVSGHNDPPRSGPRLLI
jgi:hypothetical protein